MAAYILLSSLLSIIGGCFYFCILRNRLQVLQAKYVLLSILLLSWVVPILVPSLPNYTSSLEKKYLFDYKAYNNWNVVDIKDETLLACYEKATTSKQQCECEVQQQANILYYQSNPYYNFIISIKQPIYYFFLLMMGLFLLDFILKIFCLAYLAWTSPKEKRSLQGTSFYILQTQQKLPIAISSFTLWNHYILVETNFEEDFTEQEIEAILLHEVAHLKQKDTWQQMLMYILRIFWWMQPMFYWIKKELDKLNEYVADDFAVKHIGDTKFYAKTLLKAKEQQVQYQQLNLVMHFAQGLFKQRILRLINEQPKSHSSNWVAALAFIGFIFWTTSVATLPTIQAQDIAIQQYEFLQTKNKTTGKTEFCKSCLIEEINGN